MAKTKPELAQRGAIYREIPQFRFPFAVTAAVSTIDLTQFAGQWVWIKARTLDITVLRNTTPALTLGAGFVIGAADAYLEIHIDPDGTLSMQAISTGSATLEILCDVA